MQNRQAIILLFIANIISGLAQGISMIAIPWYFVEVVSRPEVFASAYIIITFLTLFWGLYAGTLVDRHPRKKLFIIVGLIFSINLTKTTSNFCLKFYKKNDPKPLPSLPQLFEKST